VADALKANGPFSTAIGDFGYDAKGDPTRPDYVIYEWKKGADGKPTYFEK
jgi:branched-chain amino acid transport system substrate-binding protein